VVGAGLSGVGTAALSFFSQLGARAGEGGERDPSDVAWAGAIYFGSAAGVTALCAFCYTALNKLPYSRAKLLPYLAGAFSGWDVCRNEHRDMVAVSCSAGCIVLSCSCFALCLLCILLCAAAWVLVR
jgi:hypothetical protein